MGIIGDTCQLKQKFDKKLQLLATNINNKIIDKNCKIAFIKQQIVPNSRKL